MSFPASSAPQPRWLAPVLAAIVVLALGGPALVVANPPAIPRAPPKLVRVPARVVPAAELPPVEPTRFQNLPPDEARAWNAAVPFVTGANPAARPFRLTGAPDDQARAIDCLAAAMLYEAGDDPIGERAVGQVVINRARHPAFPKSICGVVFQGQERRTGCQFTFTCVGALERLPNPAAWDRARVLARQALTGTVVRKVGHATHYHTDWVVPYWSASLDKIAEIHTHLFFRWTGWWGTPAAFRRQVDGREPIVAKLVSISVAHGFQGMLPGETPAISDAALVLALRTAPAADDGTFLVTLDRLLAADQLPGYAAAVCGARDYCKLLGWTDRRATPRELPVAPYQLAAMAFSYLRDRARNFDKPLWNCAVFKRPDPHQCMKAQLPIVAASPRPEPTPSARASPIMPPVPPTPRPSASPTPVNNAGQIRPPGTPRPATP